MIFIKLTQWHPYRFDEPYSINNGSHGRALYVNADLITDMFQFNGSVLATSDSKSIPQKERPVEAYTEVNFCTRSEEGQSSRMVQETPAEIMAKIEERREFPGNPL